MVPNQLNYQHLRYFWMVARAGGLVPASKNLHLAPSTISTQIHALEDALGARLFERRGRRLRLNEMGRIVVGYADEIFSLGRELLDTVHRRPTGRPMRLEAGIADVVPKLVSRRLMQPAFELQQEMHVICHDGRPEQLLSDLALHQLNVVILDAPIRSGLSIKAFNHFLGECPVSLFGTKDLVDRYREGFPASLDSAPFLVPLGTTAIRRSLDDWFDRHEIQPHVVGEFDDSGLMKVFGQTGAGFFPAPSIVKTEVEQQYAVQELGVIEGVIDRFYAITLGRRLKHPAVIAISQAARELFAEAAQASARLDESESPGC